MMIAVDKRTADRLEGRGWQVIAEIYKRDEVVQVYLRKKKLAC